MDSFQNNPTDAMSPKKIRVMLGACKFAGKYKCSCSLGVYTSSTHELVRKDTMCEDCGHSVSLHDEFNEGYGSSVEPMMIPDDETEINNEPSPTSQLTAANGTTSPPLDITSLTLREDFNYICPRQETITHITNDLENKTALLIWGFQFTGKTTLARLLQKHLEEQGKIVIYISHLYPPEGWELRKFGWKSWESYFGKLCSAHFASTGSEDERVASEVYFIIDEPQPTKPLWFKSLHEYFAKAREGPKFCFFDSAPFPKSVAALRSVSIWGQFFHKWDSMICLLYSEAEFNDIVENFCTHAQTTIVLDKPARKYLYELTNGHPQLVSSGLNLISKLSQQAGNKRGGPRREINLGAIQSILDDNEKVFGHGEMRYEVYGTPLPQQIDNPLLEIFQTVIAKGEIKYDEKHKALTYCYETGFLLKMDRLVDVLVFPSPLHRRYVKWFYKI